MHFLLFLPFVINKDYHKRLLHATQYVGKQLVGLDAATSRQVVLTHEYSNARMSGVSDESARMSRKCYEETASVEFKLN